MTLPVPDKAPSRPDGAGRRTGVRYAGRMGPLPTEPATPLSDVTFVVLDLETTGPSPDGCAITEVGALKLRGGECLGTFDTLVNPGLPIPPDIVYLTGITEAMVAPAPPIESVLPALREFIGDAVVVGHNVRFDVGFLRANLARLGYPPLTNTTVDTLALARRLVRDDVGDHKLGTLARHFATEASACHRAFADASATAEILHLLLEQVGTIGVTALDDLLALPTTAGHPQAAAKLRWVEPLPRASGLYVFRDVEGRVLYVGRARDLRRRVRSYFAGVERRRTLPLLREAHRLDHVLCASDLEAAVLELRLLRRHRPRYNRQVAAADRMRYLRVDVDGRARRRRPVVVRTVDDAGGSRSIGPFPTPAAARAAAAVLGANDAAPDPVAARALARVARRTANARALVDAGRLEIEIAGEGLVVLERGRLVTSRFPAPAAVAPDDPEPSFLAAYLDARANRCRLLHADHGWAVPIRDGLHGGASPAGVAEAVA